MRILHLSALGTTKNNTGIVNQLEYEKRAVDILNIEWDTLLVTDLYDNIGDSRLDHVILYPRWLRYRLIKRFFVYRTIRKLMRQYDIIIMRYLPVDFFLLFVNFKNTKLFFVHHTKEGKVYDQYPNKFLSKFYRNAEFLLFKLNKNKAYGFMAVTNEIIRYEYGRGYSDQKKSFCIPNGILISNIFLDRASETEKVNLVFVSTKFYYWQGLERLLESINVYKGGIDFELHIVGDLSSAQRLLVENNHFHDKLFIYGRLTTIEINKILMKSDVGLTGLNIKGLLSEASPLKVREYLNFGLGVYSQISDSALPSDFEYYRIGEPNIEEILRFGLWIKETEKVQIKKISRYFIDKVNIINNTHMWLTNTVGKC
jgi:glycosyltransferase involved in cell wall biosynthesis